MSFDIGGFLDQRRLTRFNYIALGLSCLIMFFDGLDFAIAAFTAPYIAPDLGLDKAAIGSVFSAGTAGLVVGGIVFGWAADRVGRRPMILAAAFGFGAITLLTMFVRTLPELLILRFVDGVAIGGLMPLCWALNIECVSRRLRASVVTATQVGYTAGTAMAGPLTNWIAPEYGWRTVFMLAGVGSLLAGLLLLLFLPESVRYLAARGKHGALAKLLRQFDPRLEITPDTTFVYQDDALDGAKDGKSQLRKLFAGKFKYLTPLLWLTYAASSVSITFISNWNPTIFEDIGFTRTNAVDAAVIANLAGAVLGLLLMRFTDRIGPITVMLFPAIVAPMLLFVGLVSLEPLTFLIITVAAQAVIGGAHFGVTSITSMYYPTRLRASGGALAASIGKAMSALCLLLGGLLLASGLPAIRIFAVLAALPAILTVCAVLITLVVRRDSRARHGAIGAED